MYGKPEYDDQGRVMCEVCGQHFDRVIAHSRQVHDLGARAYKVRFGLDVKKGLLSDRSRARSQEAVYSRPEIIEALVANGQEHRFKPGSQGRTKEMVSEQTRTNLRERLRQEPMITVLREAGRKLGKSGAGNKTRWSKL